MGNFAFSNDSIHFVSEYQSMATGKEYFTQACKNLGLDLKQ